MSLVNLDAGEVISAIGSALDRIFPSPEEKAKAQAVLAQIAARPDEAQIELDKIEAASSSIFVAGWRPFIGWVCGVGLAWNYVAQPLLLFLAAALGAELKAPALDIGSLITLLLTMLGMSTLRTTEKIKDAAGNH